MSAGIAVPKERVVCPYCKGFARSKKDARTGQYTSDSVPCPNCLGVGTVETRR